MDTTDLHAALSSYASRSVESLQDDDEAQDVMEEILDQAWREEFTLQSEAEFLGYLQLAGSSIYDADQVTAVAMQSSENLKSFLMEPRIADLVSEEDAALFLNEAKDAFVIGSDWSELLGQESTPPHLYSLLHADSFSRLSEMQQEVVLRLSQHVRAQGWWLSTTPAEWETVVSRLKALAPQHLPVFCRVSHLVDWLQKAPASAQAYKERQLAYWTPETYEAYFGRSLEEDRLL